jgi:hypothetical protein
VGGAGELARQPRLADARIAGDQREPAGAGPCLRPLGVQPGERVVATDERAAVDTRQ